MILQSVGTEALLKPVFYKGDCLPTDLFVLCRDGAYRKAEHEGSVRVPGKGLAGLEGCVLAREDVRVDVHVRAGDDLQAGQAEGVERGACPGL